MTSRPRAAVRRGWMLLGLLLGGGLPAGLPQPAGAAAPAGVVGAAAVEITGRVLDPLGRPVAAAVVAAVPSGGWRAAALARSGRDGRFALRASAGWYALTATAPGLAAAFVPPVAAAAGAAARADLRLGRGGSDLRGRIEAGQPAAGLPAGALVTASRFSAEDGDIFYTAADAAGGFALRLPAATYLIGLDSPRAVAAPVEVGLGAGAYPPEVILRASPLAPAPPEVIDWLRRREVPLRSTAPGSGLADLQPVAALVGGARLVALGEATHGTREFFQLKHRLFEFLASRLGFTVFAIEAGWPESLAVDDYVLHGKGDPAALLAGLGFWTWNTEEILDLIRWMRAYNADPAHPGKLRFQGFDMQQGGVAAAAAAAYVARVDPAYGPAAARLAAAFRDGLPLSPPAAAAALTGARELLARLDRRRDADVGDGSAEDWELARHHAAVAAQSAELAAGARPDFRDRAMAANIDWLLAHQPAGARMMIWAHNNHVNHATGALFIPMGEHLWRKHGAAYLTIGMAFGQGEFQAMGRPEGGTGARRVAAFRLGPSPVGSLAAAFDRAGPAPALIDLRARPEDGPVARWLLAPHPMRETGAFFVSEADMTLSAVVTRRFDALLYVARTSRARPNPALPPPLSAAESGKH